MLTAELETEQTLIVKCGQYIGDLQIIIIVMSSYSWKDSILCYFFSIYNTPRSGPVKKRVKKVTTVF